MSTSSQRILEASAIPEFLDTAFDRDKELSVDVVTQLQQSTSP